MKLEDLITEKELPGTYAGVHFHQDTKDGLKQYLSENKIPNPLVVDKLHSTVLFSKKHLPNYTAQGDIDPPYVGTPKKLDVWKTQPDDDGNTSNCLILTYDCSDLVDRHSSLMKEHGATFDFDKYEPHVTLSYDIGDMDIKKLPMYEGDIKIMNEYQEDLNSNWADKSTEGDENE